MQPDRSVGVARGRALWIFTLMLRRRRRRRRVCCAIACAINWKYDLIILIKHFNCIDKMRATFLCEHETKTAKCNRISNGARKGGGGCGDRGWGRQNTCEGIEQCRQADKWRRLAMKMLTKVGEILEKYMGGLTKGACIIVYNKYIPLNIYIYVQQLYTNISNNLR